MTFRIDWPRVIATALGVLAGLVATAGTFAVTSAGFTLSYDAIRKVGFASGVRPDWAWLLPVSVDGAMAVATVTAVVMSRMGRAVWYPWLVVIAGAGISISCNAVHATMRDHIQLDDTTAMSVSAIPAVMLALSVHLLVVLVNAVAESMQARLTGTGQPDTEPDNTQVSAVVDLTPDMPALPAAPDTAPDTERAIPTAPKPVISRTVKRPLPVSRPASDTAAIVAKLRQKQPDITQAEVAKRINKSVRTVARCWGDTAPATEPVAEPAKTNGHAVPELIPTGGTQ